MRVVSTVAGALALIVPVFLIGIQFIFTGLGMGFILGVIAMISGWITRKQSVVGLRLGIMGALLTGVSLILLLALSAP